MSLVAEPNWRHFALIVLLASVVRGGVMFWMTDSLSEDPDAYRRIAHCITIHGVFGLESVDATSGETVGTPTAFRPPLYPWLISWFADSEGTIPNYRIAILHWVLGIATSVGTFCVASRMLRVDNFDVAVGPRLDGAALTIERGSNTRESVVSGGLAAVFAGLLVAIDPLLLQASSLVMTETLAAFLVVMTLWLWARLTQSIQADRTVSRTIGLACLTGLLCGIAYLCRPTFVLWPLALGAYLLLNGVLRRSVNFTLAGAIIFGMSAVFVGAWTLRNDRIYDKPIWATTHGGYTLLLGNNPSFYEYLQHQDSLRNAWDADFFIDRWERRFVADPRSPDFWKSEWEPTPELVAGYLPPVGEVADDRLAYQTAVGAIQQSPFSFTKACFWRLWRLHSPLPLQTGRNSFAKTYAVAFFYIVIWVLVFAGMLRLRTRLGQPKWAAGLTLWAALASVHCIYWTDMRMRAPLVPFLAILASTAVVPQMRHSGKSRQSDRQS